MNAIDVNRVDNLLQYIIAVAGQASGWDRELGMIHLIKYLYLADLKYSEHHNGQTYTGLPWRFHHFGPWCTEVYHRIEPALIAIGALKKTIEHPEFDKDFHRWINQDDQLFDSLNNKIDLIVSGAVQYYVREFGNSTAELLDFVYKTPPMINAAPGDFLDFSQFEASLRGSSFSDSKQKKESPSARQLKKRKEALQALKAKLTERLDNELKREKRCASAPRYDDIFKEGVDWLDSLVGDPVEQNELTVTVSNDMWKSKARYDSDVS